MKSKFIKGGFLLSAGSGLDRLIRLLRNVILTRLLAPEIFGVMAIIISVEKIFEVITEVGISKSIIQNKKGSNQTFLNAAWFLSVVRGIFLYFTMFLFSPIISEFYKNPDLSILIRVAFLSSLFNASMSPNVHVATKNMHYGRLVSITFFSGLFGIILTIILAFFLQSIWALVFGLLFESFSRLVLSFIICPFLPKLIFNRNETKELFLFTRGMLGLPFLTFIFMRADIFVLGKVCGNIELGFYFMANSLAQAPLQAFTSILNRLLLPIFSTKQDDTKWICKAIFKSSAIIACIFFPLLTFTFFYGKIILGTLYGEPYRVAAIPFSLLFASAMVRVCGLPIVQLYWALGRPELNRKFTAVRTIVMIALIVPLSKMYGLSGAAFSSLFASLFSILVQFHNAKTLYGFDFLSFSNMTIKIISISLLAFLPSFFCHFFLKIQIDLLSMLTVGGLSLFLSFFIGYFFLQKHILNNKFAILQTT